MKQFVFAFLLVLAAKCYAEPLWAYDFGELLRQQPRGSREVTIEFISLQEKFGKIENGLEYSEKLIYGENGKELSEDQSDLIENSFSRIVFDYDEKDNLAGEYLLLKDGSRLPIHKYEYGIAYTIDYFYAVSTCLVWATKRSVDGLGREVEWTCYDAHGTAMSKTKTTYGPDKKETYSYGRQGGPNEHREFHYQSGKLIKETTYNVLNGLENRSFTETYGYNSAGLLVLKELQNMNENIMTSHRYRYDDSKKLMEEIVEKDNGAEKISYGYDDAGDITSVTDFEKLERFGLVEWIPRHRAIRLFNSRTDVEM